MLIQPLWPVGLTPHRYQGHDDDVCPVDVSLTTTEDVIDESAPTRFNDIKHKDLLRGESNDVVGL